MKKIHYYISLQLFTYQKLNAESFGSLINIILSVIYVSSPFVSRSFLCTSHFSTCNYYPEFFVLFCFVLLLNLIYFFYFLYFVLNIF